MNRACKYSQYFEPVTVARLIMEDCGNINHTFYVVAISQ